jgi:hypothetical protein
MHKLKCSGWWEQEGLGRQPMENLELQFAHGQLRGHGADMVGEFFFTGTLSAERISLLKQYVGKHQIEYSGTSDGEGVYFGQWSSSGWIGGAWSIRVESLAGDSEDLDVREI